MGNSGLLDRFHYGSLREEERWFSFLVLLPAGLQALQIWRLLTRYERPPMTPDAGIFQHIGWLLTEGGRLYVDAWEPKPPLSFQTTAALAVVAGGDMRVYHVLNIVLMALAAVGIVVLVGLLAYHLTQDRYASALAGLSMFLLPGFVVRPAYGFKAKYMVLFAGLLAIYLAVRDRYAASGVAAAASVGYWQLGALFPLVVVGLAAQERDRRAVAEVVAGGLGFAALMFLPVVALWDSGSHMIAQALVIPMLAGGEASLLEKLYAGIIHFKWASPFVLLGVYGLWRGVRTTLGRRDWWVVAGAAWFALLVFFVDFDVGGYTDLIPGLAFVALGLGLFAASLTDDRRRSALGYALAAVLVVNFVAFGGGGLVFSRVETPGPVPMDDLRTNDRAQDLTAVPDDTPDVRYLYWQRSRPETCHYRLSLMEVNWLQRAGDVTSPDCSDLAEVRAVLDR